MGFPWILFYKPIKCVAKNPLVLVYEANGTTQIHDQIWRFHNFMPLKFNSSLRSDAQNQLFKFKAGVSNKSANMSYR